MPPQRPIPRGRSEGSPRRRRPDPLSPQPEWRRDKLFIEPSTPPASDEADDADTYPVMPPAQRPRRRSSYR